MPCVCVSNVGKQFIRGEKDRKSKRGRERERVLWHLCKWRKINKKSQEGSWKVEIIKIYGNAPVAMCIHQRRLMWIIYQFVQNAMCPIEKNREYSMKPLKRRWKAQRICWMLQYTVAVETHLHLNTISFKVGYIHCNSCETSTSNTHFCLFIYSYASFLIRYIHIIYCIIWVQFNAIRC